MTWVYRIIYSWPTKAKLREPAYSQVLIHKTKSMGRGSDPESQTAVVDGVWS